MQTTEAQKPILASGHRACAGCGQILAVRHVLEAAGRDVIVVNATGCLEVTTTPWPESAFGVAWIHSLFENAAAVASGVVASLRAQGKKTKVIAQGGDGATFDIGFGLISGMWERGDDILYICYDNEGYMNTGYQNSGATQTGSSTSTAPAGKISTGNTQTKKNLPKIAMAHGLPYVATAVASEWHDIKRKVQKALSIEGPKYLQILTPCVPGWKIKPSDTLKVAKLSMQTGIYPVFEAENGRITNATLRPENYPKVEEYLKLQKRFGHLFASEEGAQVIAQIQAQADANDQWLRTNLQKYKSKAVYKPCFF